MTESLLLFESKKYLGELDFGAQLLQEVMGPELVE